MTSAMATLMMLEYSVTKVSDCYASVSFGIPPQFVHCCLIAARAFIPASLIAIPYTILEISKFLGQLPVDDDDDDEKSQLNTGIASLGTSQCRKLTGSSSCANDAIVLQPELATYYRTFYTHVQWHALCGGCKPSSTIFFGSRWYL